MSYRRNKAYTPFGGRNMTIATVAILIALCDQTINTSIAGLAAAALSVPYVNEPPKNEADKRVPVTPVPLFVRLRWGDGEPHDLDLWVMCYSLVDGKKTNLSVVGYPQRSMGWIDLQRDDLGAPSVLNEEQLQSNSEVTRVPPNTLCSFNVHLYHSHGGNLPVKANMIVIVNKDGDNEELLGNVDLAVALPGSEITVLRAAWDGSGKLLRDSIEQHPNISTTPIATGKRGQ